MATHCVGAAPFSMLDEQPEDFWATRDRCVRSMRDTIRTLLEDCDSSVELGYVPDTTHGSWNYSWSALHFFSGSPEDFLWLAQDDRICLLDEELDDFHASVVFLQAQMFPNDSFDAAMSKISNMTHLAHFHMNGSTLLHYIFSSIWQSKPGIWGNGQSIFPIVHILLENGADVHACNSIGMTPLKHVSWCSLLNLMTNQNLTEDLSATISTLYRPFLTQWVNLLRSCGFSLRDYAARELDLGADIPVRCSQCSDVDETPSIPTHEWYGEICFFYNEMTDDLDIRFEYSQRRKEEMPGSWIS